MLTGLYAQPLSDIIDLAYKNHPSIQEKSYELDMEEAKVWTLSSLDQPRVGISKLDRGLSTNYFTIQQKIDFPLKYYYNYRLQEAQVEFSKQNLSAERLEVRKQAIDLYYKIYSQQRIIELVKINMERVKELARVSEQKYASGQASHADSMKAHFELTQLELELIRLEHDEQSSQKELEALLSASDYKNIVIQSIVEPKPDLKKLEKNYKDIIVKSSTGYLKQSFATEKAQWSKSNSYLSWAPDFLIQYQKRYEGEPRDSEIFSVSMSFPLWFWKSSKEVSLASAKLYQEKAKLDSSFQQLSSQIGSQLEKTKALYKSLNILKTTLIPQAEAAYNSTKASYRAGKTNFINLIDSERSLYQTNTNYYLTLIKLVESLTTIESKLGHQFVNWEK